MFIRITHLFPASIVCIMVLVSLLSASQAYAGPACDGILSNWDPTAQALSTVDATPDRSDSLVIGFSAIPVGADGAGGGSISATCDNGGGADAVSSAQVVFRTANLSIGGDVARVVVTGTIEMAQHSATMRIGGPGRIHNLKLDFRQRTIDGNLVPGRAVPVNLKVRSDGFDVDGNGTTDIVVATSGLDYITIVQSSTDNRIDLRGLAETTWGHGAAVQYMTGTGLVGRASPQRIWVDNTQFRMVAPNAVEPFYIEITGKAQSHIETGRGADRIQGGDGRDWVQSTGGRDVIHLGGGDDLYMDSEESRGRDFRSPIIVDGGPGFDYIHSGHFDSTLDGGPGGDQIEGGGPGQKLLGGAGNDDISFWHNAEKVDGGAGRDWIGFSGMSLQQYQRQLRFGVVCGAGDDWVQWPEFVGKGGCEHFHTNSLYVHRKWPQIINPKWPRDTADVS